MRLRDLLTDDRAVSPVIGVILMVAITVILAAVIGVFVLGIGSSGSSTPQASFGFELYDDDDGDPDAVVISHEGGDTFESGTLRVRAGDDTARWNEEVSAGDDFVAADSGGATGITVNASMDISDVSDTTFTLIYASPGGGETTKYDEFKADTV